MPALFALQMSTNDPAFWILVVVAVSFLVIAISMIAVAVILSRVVRTVKNLEERAEPLIERVGALTVEVQKLAAQGQMIGEQVREMSGHLSTATMHFSETAAILKEEARELKQLIGYSADTARDKVARVSRAIDQTHQQMTTTTAFIQSKLIEPARELAAILAGVRRGLEVFVAPSPRPINQTYGEDEMFIG